MKKSNNTIIIVITTLVLILGIIVYDRLTNIPYRPIKYMNTVNYKTQNMTYENLPKYDGKIIQSYEDYKKFQDAYNIETNINENDFNHNYYIIVFAENNYCGGSINGIRDIKINKSEVEIDIGYNGSCSSCPSDYQLFIVPVEKEYINNSTTINYKYIAENKYKC